MADDTSLVEQVTTLEEAYDVFNLGVNSDYDDVKICYHKLARKHHPDKTGNGNCSKFQHINFAFQVITTRNDKETKKYARAKAEREQKNEEWRVFREEFLNDKLFEVKTEEVKEAEKHRRRLQRKEDAHKKRAFRRLRKMNACSETL
jgi:DnaJ-class molecular chaperone